MGGTEIGDRSSEESSPIDNRFEKCKTPTLDELKIDNALKEILDTHTWDVIEAKVYGEGFQVRVQCSRCGLGRISMIYNIKHSEKMARALQED